MLKSLIIKEDDRTYRFFDLSEYGFFEKSTVRDVINETYDIILNKLKPYSESDRQNYEKINYYNHDKMKNLLFVIYQTQKKTILSICSDKIGKQTYRTFLLKLNECVTESDEKILVEKFNSTYVTNIDKLDQIDDKINDTKKILIQNINDLLVRGEKIDDLVGRSDKLRESSKLFYKKSSKLNSCCVIS
jgi:synaptobrevin family protein YKT6